MSFLYGEDMAVKVVCEAGRSFGYGNMIDRLKIAWVLHLKESGMSWSAAAVGSLLDKDRVKSIIASAKKDEAALLKWMKEYCCQPLSD